MRKVDSQTSQRKSTFNVFRNYQGKTLRRNCKLISFLRIHSCLSDLDERQITVRNHRRVDKKVAYLLHRNMMQETRRQNVFTRPGEAIPHRIPMIGTQVAGKHYSTHRNRIEIFLYIPLQNFLMPFIYNGILFSKFSFAPKHIYQKK